RELPRGEIRVELAGKRLAHEVQPGPRGKETGAPERTALSRPRYRDQPFDARRHGQQARPQERSCISDEICDVVDRCPAVALRADDRVAPAGRERNVRARRLDVAPVHVLRIAEDVVGPARARVARVTEPLDPGRRLDAARAEPRERPGPDPNATDLGPPQRPEEDRRRRLRREREHDRHAALRRLLLVLALERLEDPLPARLGSRRGVDGEARDLLFAAEPHPKQRVRSDADDPSVLLRDRHDRARRVVAEPPVELRAGERELAPRVLQQPEVVLPMLRLVRDQLVGHYFVDVPSAALNRRRACVPVTVSFTEIRSHAPDSTSSNVRGGYGSMLYRRSCNGSVDGEFAPETAVNATS